jgi:transcriptional regulator with XRE-family HTH domain
MLSEQRRREVAVFLRTRRARIKPADVGLPAGARRRTPGLRREEVAARAEVSTEWYTWLEQARDVRASADVLRRIAAALRLEPSATRHLLTLAGYGPQTHDEAGSRSVAVSPHMQRLLDRLNPYPAWVQGERWDVVAWNAAATVIYGDFAAMDGLRRNMLCVLFLDPSMRRVLVDWDRITRTVVAKVRSIHAGYVEDPWYNELVDMLRARSREFVALWDDHDIHAYQDDVKAFAHPELGRLSFDFSVLELRDERFANLSLVTYVPQPGTGTAEALERALALRAVDRQRDSAVPV